LSISFKKRTLPHIAGDFGEQVMCSEAVWWRCHRRLVADNLPAKDESVFHLMGKDRVQSAKLTAGALISENGIAPAKA
jgi:uncharacterized protein (DUF488 family)